MAEPVVWLADGTPHSPRFHDIYASCAGAWEQARHVFLGGCGLPGAWRGQRQWRILETGFGLGLNFLAAWHAWREDPARPSLLHFASVEAYPVAPQDLLRAAEAHPALEPLAQALAAQWWGLLPGVHRLAFEDGRVLLSLGIGDVQTSLAAQRFAADSVFLDGFSPDTNPDMWSTATLQAVARLCRPGTRLASWTVARSVRDTLAQCGFEARKAPGLPPKRDCLQAVFAPAWTPRSAPPAEYSPARCAVVGGGIAGASAAASLARRGWQVQVLDAAATPASGASGLPAGLFAPHVSTDDRVLSRLTRAGVRHTLQAASRLLQEGADWSPCGVLEHRVDGSRGLSALTSPESEAWSAPATTAQLAQARLPETAVGCWHARAGWLRPAALVAALLNGTGIVWRGRTVVETLVHGDGTWQLRDAAGATLAEAELVVIAAGPASQALLGTHLPLTPIRGQVSLGPGSETLAAVLPPFPVNGHGSLLGHVPGRDGPQWLLGATFDRSRSAPETLEADQQANFDKLRALLPHAAAALSPWFEGTASQAGSWSGVRCASRDRLPLVGAVDAAARPGLMASTAMGARGLTLALLCAEVLAAGLHAEPLPVDLRLAQALRADRFGTGP